LEQERQSLLDERRKLEHEYDRLPDRLRRDAEDAQGS
jgi:hypothetical protein